MLDHDFKNSDQLFYLENLDTVVKELKKNFKQLQMVYKNQQFQQIRDEVHAECKISHIFVCL